MGELVQPHSTAVNGIDAGRRAVAAGLRSVRPSFGRPQAAGLAAAALALLVLGARGGAVAAALALLALFAATVAFRRPHLAGPLVALLLPAGDYIHVLQAQVAPLEATVGGSAIGVVARYAVRRERPRLRAEHWAFAALACFVGLSVLGPPDDSAQLRQLAFWGACGVVFYAASTHLDTPPRVTIMLVSLAIPALVEASLALVEYASHWSERYSRLHGAIVYPLPKGTLDHPNALGQFLVVTGFTVLALTLARGGMARRLGFLTVALAALALVATFSRGSWLAVAGGACVFLADRRTRIPVAAAGGAVAAAAALLALEARSAIGERISSLFTIGETGLSNFRIQLAERAARIAAAHPLTGSGHFEEHGIYAGRPDVATHPHNLFLGLAVFFGIPAALAFGAVVVLAVRASWTGFRRRRGGERLAALAFLGLVAALLVNGLFEYPFWQPSLVAVIVLALATVFALERGAVAAGKA